MNSYLEDRRDTFVMAVYDRDCRGGNGNRETSFEILRWFSVNDPDMLLENIEHLPFFGRWLDMFELFDTVATNKITDIVTKQLIYDSYSMIVKKPCSILAKWIPSENSRLDKKFGVYGHLTEAIYGEDSNKNRKLFRKEKLTPLREYIDVVERKMCSGNWDLIDFQKVPSVCMHKSNDAFRRHVPDLFSKYLESVKKGEKKINSSQVYPHELVKNYINDGEVNDVIEAQWKEIVKHVNEFGTLGDTVAVVDVSSSMEGLPMEVSIAIGILISECSSDSFKGFVYTFDTKPSFLKVEGETLHEKVNCIKKMPWGGSTNIEAVFDLILNRAKQLNLKQDQIPSRLIILSDMQFNGNSGCECDDTTLMMIKKKFLMSGYIRPDLVVWNLRSNTPSDFVSQADENGVIMISGFSPSLLKSIIDSKNFTPWNMMREILDKPRYDIIKVPKV